MKVASLTHARCWAVADLDVLADNLSVLRRRVPDTCAFLAVIKANAYGHGIIPAARVCEECGVDYLGAATLGEAVQLREQGISLPILILGVTDPSFAETMQELRLTPVVPSLAYAEALSARISRRGAPLAVHFCVDTGMGRLGPEVRDENIAALCRDIASAAELPGLYLEGLMTQLSSARGTTPEAEAYTRRQLKLFDTLTEKVRAQGVSLRYAHALNSGGILHYPENCFDMVRVGHLLFEPIENDRGLVIRPVLEAAASLAYVKTLPAGACIGYGRSHVLEKPSRIGVVNMGYCDGYGYALSGRGSLLLRGHRVPVVGAVCMDQTMIDVSAVPNARPGDTVTLIGTSGDLVQTAEDINRQALGAFDGAFPCALTERVSRYYRIGGQLHRYDPEKKDFIRL